MIERTLVNNYVRSWNPQYGAWAKRGDAADFAAFLAGELEINPKGVMVEKDGKHYRVFVPLLSRYWDVLPIMTPKEGLMPPDWEHTLSEFKSEKKRWATT